VRDGTYFASIGCTRGSDLEQFYAQGSWTYRRDGGRGTSGLCRSTDDRCADCEYEPDNRTLCRNLHWFLRALIRARLRAFFGLAGIGLQSCHLASEKKPTLGGGEKPLLILRFALRLREFPFGVRSTLGGCKHGIPSSTLGNLIAGGQGKSLFKTDHMWPDLIFWNTQHRLLFRIRKSGPAVASRSEQYRTKAEECRALAEMARDPVVERQYKDLVVHWRHLAEQAETFGSLARPQSE
jgi:hypothetical protein